MGPMIAFLAVSVVVALAVLGAVAMPHWQRRRETVAPSRHTSRTQRVEP